MFLTVATHFEVIVADATGAVGFLGSEVMYSFCHFGVVGDSIGDIKLTVAADGIAFQWYSLV